MSCEVCLLWFVRRSLVQRHRLRPTRSHVERSVNTCSSRDVKRSRPSKILSEEYGVMVEAVTGGSLLYRSINKDNPTTAFFGRITAIPLIEPPR
jgi:hypothetical protein